MKKEHNLPSVHQVEKGKIAAVLTDAILWRRRDGDADTALNVSKSIEKGKFVWVVSDPTLEWINGVDIQTWFYQVLFEESFFWIRVKEVVNPHYNGK